MEKLSRTPVIVWFVYLLTLLFIGLKLTGHITWSWFWVLSPLIFMFGLAFSLIIFTFLLLLVVYIIEENTR